MYLQEARMNYNIQTFYFDGYLHRQDGPAIIWHDGEEHWFYYGYRHRTDGPAIVRKDGTVEYYLHGEIVTVKVHNDFQAIKNLLKNLTTS